MPIDLLTVCVWFKPGEADAEIMHPTWSQVEEAIRALDGHSRNDLYLQPRSEEAETWLAVGGGAGQYLVTGSVNSERFPTVVRESNREEEKVLLMVGGQVGDYPRRWIIDLETALFAARHFFESGEFGGDICWEDA
jgi:hypothetical protein